MNILPDAENGIAELHLEERYWKAMKIHVISCLPDEACGLLAGRGWNIFEVIRVTNVLHSPHRFRMDPEEQWAAMVHLEKEGYQILGIFHSHVCTIAELSETDLEEITYPEVAYLIWAKLGDDWHCRAYRIRSEGPVEIPITIHVE